MHDLEDFLASLDDPKELQHVQGIQQPHMQHNLLEFNNQLNPLALNNAPIPDLGKYEDKLYYYAIKICLKSKYK